MWRARAGNNSPSTLTGRHPSRGTSSSRPGPPFTADGRKELQMISVTLIQAAIVLLVVAKRLGVVVDDGVPF